MTSLELEYTLMTNLVFPLPRRGLALTCSLGLEEICSTAFSSLIPQSSIRAVSFTRQFLLFGVIYSLVCKRSEVLKYWLEREHPEDKFR